MVSTLVQVCQYGTAFKKNVNCIQIFEKVLQLCPFQIINTVNGVPHVIMCFFLFFLFIFIFLQKKMPCARSLVWPVALSVSHGNTMSCVSVIIKCHCIDFNLVLVYVFLGVISNVREVWVSERILGSWRQGLSFWGQRRSLGLR